MNEMEAVLQDPLLEKTREGAHPSYFNQCSKTKPPLYFVVKVVHPPDIERKTKVA
jgi:hypothetical protein